MTRVATRLFGFAVGAAVGAGALAWWTTVMDRQRGLLVADLFIENCLSRISDRFEDAFSAPTATVNGPDGPSLWDDRTRMVLSIGQTECTVTDVYDHMTDDQRVVAIGAVLDRSLEIMPEATVETLTNLPFVEPNIVASKKRMAGADRPLPAVWASRMMTGEPEDPTTGATSITLLTEPTPPSRTMPRPSGNDGIKVRIVPLTQWSDT